MSLTTTAADVAERIDDAIDSHLEAALEAASDGNRDGEEFHTGRAHAWLAIRDVLTRAVAS